MNDIKHRKTKFVNEAYEYITGEYTIAKNYHIYIKTQLLIFFLTEECKPLEKIFDIIGIPNDDEQIELLVDDNSSRWELQKRIIDILNGEYEEV